LAFLGCALAVFPAVGGGRQLFGYAVDGLLLTVGGLAVTPLVMTRIGRLYAERARAECVLLYQATHDALTGLANRREFIAQLSTELSQSAGCVVLFCDLDGFKGVNDRLGHAAGDRLLIEVARRLRGCARENDLVSRFGGDEFVVLYRQGTAADVGPLCERVRAVLSPPVTLGYESASISASVGGSASSGTAEVDTAYALIQRADQAMYASKQTGRDRARLAIE
jgi:diguanylate cyclase (GGDEF)-like protein